MDHLFRHQYGKMISILTRIFGLSKLETIEDAVQDTFLLAMDKWRTQLPKNPEAWLTMAAKNRAIDLLRKIKADSTRLTKLEATPTESEIDQLFLDHEIEDSQLRMIFTACHPALNPRDQIAFALKTIAGFSAKEIASALLLKEETVKKRLMRARKAIKDQAIAFTLPDKRDLKERLDRVHEVLYLIFNEGFHSSSQQLLIRKDLCGEALRLCKIVLKNEAIRTGASYALFALFCFHSSRLETKISEDGQVIDLRNQDRSKWFKPLMHVGNEALRQAMSYEFLSTYHLEAAIAVEHIQARSFETTNWSEILKLYQRLYNHHPNSLTALNIAIVHLQLQENKQAIKILKEINVRSLEQRAYLYHGTMAEYYQNIGKIDKAINCINQALETVVNSSEKKYLEAKRRVLEG